MLALGEQRIGPQEAARRLNVEYVASGSVTRRWGRLVVAVELIEATSGRILWSEDFDRREQDVFTVIEDVGNQIVAAIANEIEAVGVGKLLYDLFLLRRKSKTSSIK